MTGPLKPRGYQLDALAAIGESLKTHNRVACVLPTGLGKTVVFAHLIAQQPGRTLVLVHREELAEQAVAKIHSVAPHLKIGIVKAERNEIAGRDVIVASVQTLANRSRREMITGVDLVVVDECHHAVARTWMEVLAHFGCYDEPLLVPVDDEDGEWTEATPRTPAVGFTATLNRTDGKGLGDVWETVAFEKDILYGIDGGYLTDVRGVAVTVDGLDLATIAKSRGDYQEGQLGEAMEASGAGEAIARAYLEHAAQRQGVLFTPTVATAYSWAQSLRDVGIEAATIEGNTSSEDRKLIYKRYQEGEIRVLANAMVLTEGWDAPWCEVAVIARPTQSPALYTQMVGRVLRPWPGKADALVLDVVGVSGRHKLQSLTSLLKTEVHEGESYAEARARIEAEREGLQKVKSQVKLGSLAAKQVELFANSHSVWLQTKAGTWFIPVKDGVFFLWPDDDGTFRLGYKQQGRSRTRVATRTASTGGYFALEENVVQMARQNGWIETGLTLEYAMAWGEQLANDDDPTVSMKDRAWRRTKPSEAQVAFALKLGINPEVATSVRKGELSDLISVAVASRMLDR